MMKENLKTYTGFGYALPAKKWAELLGMRLSELSYYAEEKDLSVEDMYKLRGIIFNPPRGRKDRWGGKMKDTQDEIFLLLLRSGYVLPKETKHTITVKPLDKKGNHQVKFKDSIVGAFNYRTGVLTLSNREGLHLRRLEEEEAEPMVRQNDAGLWEVHPLTRGANVGVTLQDRLDRHGELDLQELYSSLREPPEKTGRQLETYEGFGREYTCAEWARRLGVPRSTLWRWLVRGETIEEFARKKNIKFE